MTKEPLLTTSRQGRRRATGVGSLDFLVWGPGCFLGRGRGVGW